ncbi:flavin reductase family protein [Nonomuraea sp. NPDC050451]|uniref:flavin reductase family protein n=1 Tax=Nonomuraea sp. NPDC050451 TaxID=3364364 RepID=UPI0037892280
MTIGHAARHGPDPRTPLPPDAAPHGPDPRAALSSGAAPHDAGPLGAVSHGTEASPNGARGSSEGTSRLAKGRGRPADGRRAPSGRAGVPSEGVGVPSDGAGAAGRYGEAGAGVDAGRFRAIFGALPTAVAVVTVLDRDSVPRGLTCNAVTAVSLRPPLLLVCVDRQARSLPALRRSGAFAVNFLAEGRHELAARFAGKGEDKFAGLRWTPSPANGAPLLAQDVVAHAGCRLVEVIEAGDHWILLGLVESGDVHDRPPLVYRNGEYRSLL